MLVNRALTVLFVISLVCISVWAQEHQPASQPANQPASQPAASSEDVARITVDELKTKLDKNEKVVIVDVRKHIGTIIKGAVHIPLEDIEKRLNELPKNKLIVTVCT